MISVNNKYTYVLLPIIIIITCFVAWTPSQLIITDEISYYFQSLNWINGNTGNTIIDSVSGTTYTLIEGHYPPGNSFILSLAHSLYSRLFYLLGFFYLLGSIYLCYKILKENHIPFLSLSVLYLFVPLIVISRTSMSEMPSLFLVTVGIYLYFKNGSKSYIYLAFLTGLSVAFRETNILLLAPFTFFISRNYIYTILAFLIGVSFRTMGYYILIMNPFYIKEGYPFGFKYLPETILVYAIILIILLPLSPFWFSKVPQEKKVPFQIAIGSFLLLHLFYGYLGHDYSGCLNGIILNGRFWIPALPIFVVALGYYIKDTRFVNKTYISVLIIFFIIICNVGVHYKSNQKEKVYQEFSAIIKKESKGELTFIDMNYRTPIFRYIYSYVQDRDWSNINLVNNEYHISQLLKNRIKFRVVIITSTATSAQNNRNSKFYKIIETLKIKYSTKEIISICPDLSSCINIYEVYINETLELTE